MLLDSTTIGDLADMLAPHMALPAWPGLTAPKAKARARRWAKKLGIWDRIGAELDIAKPILVIKRSDYRRYRRTGDRRVGESVYHARRDETITAALALWLGHPAADVDYLQDLLWAWCETTTWIWAAHEGRHVDLASSAFARLFAEILCMHDVVLEDEVKERMGRAIEEKALDPVGDWRRPDFWHTIPMNWNHVCNANMITVALYRIRDPKLLANYIHPLIQRLDYALHGFASDGGCLEGPGYWNYGFGHYVHAATVLHHRTGGALDLMAGERVERICRYPLAAHIDGPIRTCFADGGHGFMLAETILDINRFVDLPQLHETAARDGDGHLAVSEWRGLLSYSGQKATGKRDTTDRVLPDLGQAKLWNGGACLAVLAGSNDVPHNHNDIGSFMVYKHGTLALTDPAAPKYTAKTFGPNRYDILHCRSRGHSVPLVNGREQVAGSAYRGTLEVDDVNGDGPKTATIDMTRAYADKTLTSLVRRFVLDRDGAVTLTDTYEFARKPRALEEAFVTYEDVRVAKGSRAVTIGKGAQKVTLRAKGTAGAFAAERLVEESKEGRTDGVVTRITFVPAALARDMALTFTIT
ncbi:heparinase II/III family protein [bacterium]|nr:heparinase II/III family protein [bacterium]